MKVSDYLSEVLAVKNTRDAERVFNKLVLGVSCHNQCSLDEAETIVRDQIGYHITDHEQRLKIKKYYDCIHPWFGEPTETPITASEAYRLGIQHAKKLMLNEKQKRNQSELS